MYLRKKQFVVFIPGKTQLVSSFYWSSNTLAIDVKKDGSVLEEKPSVKMLGLTFSSKLDWSSYIISIAKSVSKKIGALIRSIKFISPDVALYLYKSTIRPSMEYCYPIWVCPPSYYLEFQVVTRWISCKYGYEGLLVLHLLLLLNLLLRLAALQNVTSLSLFYRYYFGRFSPELTELVPLP